MRIGLYGGSFNPVHAGHLIVSRAVAETMHLDKVILIPAAIPPHRLLKDLAPAAHRLAMLRLAVAGETLFGVSDIEIRRAGPSYTVDTVQDYRNLNPSDDLFWLVGADSLIELPNWYQVDRLVESCQVVTAARPGYDDIDIGKLMTRFAPEQVARLQAHILPTPRIDISASDIRCRLAAGLSIRYLVPEPVAEYIAKHGLYREGSP